MAPVHHQPDQEHQVKLALIGGHDALLLPSPVHVADVDEGAIRNHLKRLVPNYDPHMGLQAALDAYVVACTRVAAKAANEAIKAWFETGASAVPVPEPTSYTPPTPKILQVQHKEKQVAKSKTEKKVGKVMREFSHGKLHSGSKHGPSVKSKAQALAIGYSEARGKKK